MIVDVVRPRKRKRWPRTRGVRRWDPTSPTLMRKPEVIDGFTFHQMGIDIPPSDRLVKRFGELAPAIRSYRTGYHVTVLKSGTIVHQRPLLAYANQAGRLNRRTVGVAFEGYGELTKAARAAMPELFAFLLGEAGSCDIDLRYVFAHRQSSKNRTRDPGPTIWRAVLDHADAVGLESDPGWTVGSGKPIPGDWQLPPMDADWQYV